MITPIPQDGKPPMLVRGTNVVAVARVRRVMERMAVVEHEVPEDGN